MLSSNSTKQVNAFKSTLKVGILLLMSFALLIVYVLGQVQGESSPPTTQATPDIYSSYQKQAQAIIKGMSLEEKIGQMLLPTFDLLANDKGPQTIGNGIKAWNSETDLKTLGEICGMDGIKKYHIGAVLQAGGPIIFSGDDQSNSNWKKLADMAKLFYNGPKGTILLLGTDAIHGDQHVPGTILFPHDIGLGATHNPKLVRKVADWTMRDMGRNGFNWSFMPTVAIAKDYRWGRTYESFGQQSEVVKALSYQYILGLQDVEGNKINGVVATAKHFIGDGATRDGWDEGESYGLNLARYWKDNGAGWEGAVEAQAGSLMVSYSSINDIPMHFGGDWNVLNQFLGKGITDSQGHVFKFGGFSVSDYVGVSRAAYKYNKLNQEKIDFVQAVAKAVNAGVDMLMIANRAFENPFDYDPNPPYTMKSKTYYDNIKTVRDSLLEAVKKGLISAERIDQAVERIMRTKLSLVEQPTEDLTAEELEQEAVVARQAAEQSLVLLKNSSGAIPVKSTNLHHVFLLGDYDDIGLQNGGWTINWQGQKGNEFWKEGSNNKKQSFATSLLDGVRDLLGDQAVIHVDVDGVLKDASKQITSDNSIALIVISEPPYAEYMGDVANDNPWYLRGALGAENAYMTARQADFLGVVFSAAQQESIRLLKERGVKIVTVLFSGRPVVITTPENDGPFDLSDAFIAAFLPGTSGGEALANAIFGKYAFRSHQSVIDGVTYFSNTLPFDWPASMEEVRSHRYSLFPAGFGLK